jgi:hypothetical protein
MPTRNARRLAASLVAFALVTTACGLKKEALQSLKQGSSNGGIPGEGVLPGSSASPDALGTPGVNGQLPGSNGQLPGGNGGTGGTGSTGGNGGTGATGSTGGTGGPGGGVAKPCDPPTGGDTTGITSTSIRIGVHAPQTGTGAPLPPSFEKGVQVYWNQKAHYICGRHVIVDFQDDKYTPQTARNVCGPMSRRDFLVFGAAGTDQIQSCATMPDIKDKGVPYISAGVTSNGLAGLPHYFAVSLTYEQQGALVVKNAISRGFGKPTAAGGKWAIVTGQSGNFNDATRGAENALRAAGIPFDTIRVNQTSDNGLQQRAFATGDQISGKGYGVVYVVTSPGYFVYMAGKANKNPSGAGLYNPMYTGPGVTMTEVTVAQLLCSNANNSTIRANFLAPFPGIDRATADFKAATGGQYDDIFWALWGQAQLMEQALRAASANLTRQNFIATLNAIQLNAGVFAPVRFPGPASPGSHFGGTGAYSQDLDCGTTEPNQSQAGGWKTFGGRLDK